VPACVGRERELAWITARLDATSANGTAAVLVSGPSGIGKSRLLDELRDQARSVSFPVLEGWCIRHAAFAPFLAIASQALALLRARDEQHLLSPAHLEALAPLVSARAPRGREDVDATEAAAGFTEAVSRLLSAVGRQRPVLVLIRGAARMDEASSALVRALLDAAGPAGEPTPGAASALLVASTREREPSAAFDHARAEMLPIHGLEAEALGRLLTEPSLLQRLHATTDGNPAVLLGLLGRPPSSRGDEVRSRMDELGEVPRRVVATLALADRPLPVLVLAAAIGVDAPSVHRAVPPLVGADLARRTLDPTVGDVVVGLARHDDGARVLSGYADSECMAIRARLGVALAEWGRATPEEVVLHRLAGGTGAGLVSESIEVARSLLQRHAPASALALLEACAQVADAAALKEVATLAMAAARAAGSELEARGHVLRAREANPNDPELARLEAVIALSEGDLPRAERALEQAEATLAPGDDEERAMVLLSRAELRYQQGRFEEAERFALDALARTAEPRRVAEARNVVTKVLLVRRDFDRGQAWTEESLVLARARRSQDELLRGLINLGVVAIWRDDLDEAQRRFAEARAVAVRGGSMMLQGVLRENEAVVAHLQGRYGDALRSYQEALEILTRVGNRRFVARVANNLGELYAQVGAGERARRLCEHAARVARGLSGSLAAESRMLRAQVELVEGRSDAAAEAAREAARHFAAAGDTERLAGARLLLTRAALLDGDVARAGQFLSEVPDGEEVSPRTRAERAAYEAEWERARGHDGLPAARLALERSEAVGDRELQFRAEVLVATALLHRGDVLTARRHVERAASLRAAILGAVPDALRVGFGAQLERTGIAQLEARLETYAAPVSVTTLSPRPSIAAPAMEPTGLIGDSAAMRELRRRIHRVAPQDVTVLIQGESGTGKERVAEALHRGSRRREGPLVKVNCAALAEGVLLSELFGHERGAFTGADRRRRGRFEIADGGTIFLDEIGDVSPATQAALLRVLQERCFERVGGNETLRVDVRVLAATNRDLGAMVAARTFREDLYFRLSSLTIKLPPLRERRDDLPALAAWFLERAAVESGTRPRRLTTAALRRLTEHGWPGNVRELENVLRASALLAETEDLSPEDLQGLPDVTRVTSPPSHPSMPPPPPTSTINEVDLVYRRIRAGGVALFDMRREIERGCIAQALEEAGGNITRAATLLGMKRPRLSQLVREYGLAKGSAHEDNA